MKRRSFLKAVASVAFAAAVGFPEMMRPRQLATPEPEAAEIGFFIPDHLYSRIVKHSVNPDVVPVLFMSGEIYVLQRGGSHD